MGCHRQVGQVSPQRFRIDPKGECRSDRAADVGTESIGIDDTDRASGYSNGATR